MDEEIIVGVCQVGYDYGTVGQIYYIRFVVCGIDITQLIEYNF